MVVFVLNQNCEPLMPCKPAKARHLLKSGKAKVVSVNPFTIRLKFANTHYTQPLVIGIDPGFKTLGVSVRKVNSNVVVYASETNLKQDIKKKLTRKKTYRRNRRNRKTRYRQARFLNRTRASGWIPPSLESKINTIKKEIEFVLDHLPITRIKFEYSNFDTHKLKNPNVKGWRYQKGEMFGFENVKCYVRFRDKFKCKVCKKTKTQIQIHHIKFRINKGTDKPSNLITLCSVCHKKIHENKLELTNNLVKSLGINNQADTQTSIVSLRIWNWLKTLGIKHVVKTYGYVTKVKRGLLSIPKTHVGDAIAISYSKQPKYKKHLKKPVVENSYQKTCVAKGWGPHLTSLRC